MKYLCKTATALLASCVIEAMGGPDNNYVLLEGAGAQEKLDFQHALTRGIFNQAFQDAASLKKLEGATVVDFGCGTSSAYPDIRRFVGDSGQYIGIDSSEKQVAFNQERFKDLVYIVGDETTKAAQEVLASADGIFIRYVVMHQKDPGAFIQSIYALAKPGAIFVIQEPESDLARRAWVEERYPFAVNLCDIRKKLGERRGLNYEFGPQIKGVLEALSPQALQHSTAYLELPLGQAKEFLYKTLKEIHAKDPSSIDEADLAAYFDSIGTLPDAAAEPWKVDLMHTYVVQKNL